MKIDTRQIPAEGLDLAEELSPRQLDLDTAIIKFSGPIPITAQVSKITNVLSVELAVNAQILCTCSRCLEDFKKDLKKNIRLNYQVDNLAPLIDLDPDIRDEIMLEYPLKPLCKPDCKGLCPKCGKNLNEGGCSCATT